MKGTKAYNLIFCREMGEHPQRDCLKAIVDGPQKDKKMEFVRDDQGYFYVVEADVASTIVADLRKILGTAKVVRYDPAIRADTLSKAKDEGLTRVNAITVRVKSASAPARPRGPGGWHGAPAGSSRFQIP